ncbi:MAG: AtpZ/AtpI family protein [Oscillospiraceae bacterium]|nr:AtpZ/AtpI family protein [Oscillospiraceae bacterium]
MKNKSVFTALGMVTQFGISTITPMLLCIFAALWLQSRFGLGDWVMLVGVLMGVGSGFMSMMKMIRQMSELSRKEDEDA